MDKSVVALLPMKAHSERVANKNIRAFNGKPLYEWVLNTLLDSKYVSKIIIDTDSPFILERVKPLEKVMGVLRPDALRGDFVAVNKIIEHDMSLTEREYFLQTHATNPLLSLETVNKAIKTFFEKQSAFDSLLSVIKHQSRFYDEACQPINHDPKEMIRSQDTPCLYEENSNIFIFSKDSFFNNDKNRVGEKPFMFVMDKKESSDIDDEDDFTFCEMLCKCYKERD